MNLGVKRGTVKLQDYNKNWETEYIKEKDLLITIFKDNYLEIAHIGSTSIPNLSAKPLIDIAILTNNIEQLGEIPNILIKNNYIERVGRLRGRQRVFAKEVDSIVTHHLHIIEFGEIDWELKMRFKKILLSDEKILNDYSILKKKLFLKFENNRIEYTKGKANFILKTLDL